LEDKKENDKKPEVPLDEKRTEEDKNIEEGSKEQDLQESVEEESIKDKTSSEEPVEEENVEKQSDEQKPVEEKTSTEETVEESEEKPAVEEKETKPDTETKKEKIKTEGKKGKKEEHKEDFKYIVRIANTDINGEKTVVYGLTSIKGIGLHLATAIADISGIDRNKKIGDLDDKNIEKLQQTIDSISENTPTWMLNHRKDYETGVDKHLVGSEIDMKLRDEINVMKKIRCYRGIRHERGLPVRGQRTRANNRKGLALGVSRKRT